MKKILFIITLFGFSLLSCFDGLNDAYNKKSGLKMVHVPAGTFDYDDTTTTPTCRIYVSAFYMSSCEITREQFKEIMGFDPSGVADSPTTDCPVDRVSWFQAIVFCNRLSIREDREPVYTINGSTDPDDWGSVPTTNIDPTYAAWNSVICNMNADGYRLPTEMEWRWAAMGATKDSRSGDIVGEVNTNGFTKGYAGSIESVTIPVNIGNYVWYYENSGLNGTSAAPRTSHPVGTKLPNELGLYDMSGNVWEWCWDKTNTSDLFSPTGNLINYTGLSGTAYRIIVGRNVDENYDVMLVQNRTASSSRFEYNTMTWVGFRVARSAGSNY